jgi:hypothetical protein
VARIRVEWCERFARGAASASVASDAGLSAARHAAGKCNQAHAKYQKSLCAGTTSAMSRRASAFGATSDPRLPPTSAARSAKIAMLTRSDSPSDANAQSAVLKPELRRGNTPLLLKLRCALRNCLIEKLLHLPGSLLRKVALLTAQFTLLLAEFSLLCSQDAHLITQL